ncbi:MAG: hypothetical protein JWP34_585 [Massilia sp.]|nr:hypothetical protein [Massilia sp.]
MQAMQSKSTTWRWTIWIACFAVLMNALAPSISHAMAARDNWPATREICRADGSTLGVEGQPDLVAVSQLANKIAHHKVASMEDCGYCLPHGGSFALMPSTITGLGLMGGHALRPFLFYRAPQPLLALSAAPPRGPPATS